MHTAVETVAWARPAVLRAGPATESPARAPATAGLAVTAATGVSAPSVVRAGAAAKAAPTTAPRETTVRTEPAAPQVLGRHGSKTSSGCPTVAISLCRTTGSSSAPIFESKCRTAHVLAVRYEPISSAAGSTCIRRIRVRRVPDELPPSALSYCTAGFLSYPSHRLSTTRGR